jgi:hypothetical protein
MDVDLLRYPPVGQRHQALLFDFAQQLKVMMPGSVRLILNGGSFRLPADAVLILNLEKHEGNMTLRLAKKREINASGLQMSPI